MIFKFIIDLLFGFYETIFSLIPDIPGQSNFISYIQSAITFFGTAFTWASFWLPISTLLWCIKFEIGFRVAIALYRIARDIIQLVSGGIIKK